MSVSIEQHNVEIQANRECWTRKAALRAVYGEFYRQIASRLTKDAPGAVVELGSGLSNIRPFIPNCITTDLFPNTGIDRMEDAYRLSFGTASLSNLILFDVWHHLEFPGSALAEFHRVLAPAGRVILFEPAMGLIGRFVFGCFHHEPLALTRPITWEAPPGFDSGRLGYYAAQGNASRIFGGSKFKDRLSGWRIPEIAYFPGLAYLATGGFRGPQIAPDPVIRRLGSVDAVLSRFGWLASRMLVVLE